jgi:polyhydroxyalkanoate synthesis regulator phasin
MLRSTDRRKERSMAKLQEVRKTIEASLGNMTPTRAQEIAKGMLDRDAAKEQVSKTAADLMEWSQRNRARLSTMIRGEVRDQLRQSGVATSEELNALRKRVRDLERTVKATGAGRSTAKRTAASGSKRTPTKGAAKRSGTTTG